MGFAFDVESKLSIRHVKIPILRVPECFLLNNCKFDLGNVDNNQSVICEYTFSHVIVTAVRALCRNLSCSKLLVHF